MSVDPSYSGDLTGLVWNIKQALIAEDYSQFGVNTNIYKSDIIATVQGVQGVGYCSLNQPQSDIFFTFNVDNFTQEQLLEYAPDYIYFGLDNISVKVVS